MLTVPPQPSQNQLMPQSLPAQSGGGLPPGTNALQQAVAPAMQQPQQQPTPQPPTMQQIQHAHQKLDDFQHELKKLIQTPDDELTIGKVFSAASDAITQNRLTSGKRGATAMDVARELAAPDFPREKDGVKPTPQEIRKFLIGQFMKSVGLQAQLTSKFAPPPQQPQMPGTSQEPPAQGMPNG